MKKNAKTMLPRDLTAVIDIECSLLNPENVPSPDTSGGEPDYRAVFRGADGLDIYQKGVSQIHIPVSIGIAFLNHKYEVIDYVVRVSDTVEEEFPNLIKREVDRVNDGITRYSLCMTPAERRIHASIPSCQICGRDFLPKQARCRDHDHHDPGYYDANGKLIRDNCRYTLCTECNIVLTGKRKKTLCIAHNMGKYDLPALFKGLVESGEDLNGFRILKKGSNGFYRLVWCNIEFIDTMSFIPGSLSKLVSRLCNNIETDGVDSVLPCTAGMTRVLYGAEMLDFCL